MLLWGLPSRAGLLRESETLVNTANGKVNYFLNWPEVGSGCIWMVAGAELTENPLSAAVCGDWLSFPLGTQGHTDNPSLGYMGPSLPRLLWGRLAEGMLGTICLSCP